jgi:hypothetical protein
MVQRWPPRRRALAGTILLRPAIPVYECQNLPYRGDPGSRFFLAPYRARLHGVSVRCSMVAHVNEAGEADSLLVNYQPLAAALLLARLGSCEAAAHSAPYSRTSPIPRSSRTGARSPPSPQLARQDQTREPRMACSHARIGRRPSRSKCSCGNESFGNPAQMGGAKHAPPLRLQVRGVAELSDQLACRCQGVSRLCSRRPREISLAPAEGPGALAHLPVVRNLASRLHLAWRTDSARAAGGAA